MGKTLIIAEKPSVMTDLSRVLAKELGKFEKSGSGRDVFFENDKAVITSAVGHLVELRMPMGPNGKKLPWNFNVLPAIPDKFDLDPIPDSEARLKQVLKLAKRKDIDLIVNACDAGREGELIFRYIMEIGGVEKPVKRLWMQSMTNDSILEAWKQLRPGESMKPLADAAKCRSESDWLVGLNATRALTCFNSRHGGFNITAAGRVQTPTLAILAQREAEIQAFKPTPYFEVHASFGVEAGEYLGKWIDESWKKDETKPLARPERIWDKLTAETIQARCQGKTGMISEEKKAQSQISPQLYDLTTLQREAPFSAKGTLQIAQALYEKHKMITYPRTDSRYLPEDYTGNVRETMADVGNSGLDVAKYAKAVLSGSDEKGPRLHKSHRVFDSKKVSDHFAIIPTGKFAKLSEAEQKLYDMIVKRFIAVFYPSAEFEQTTRLTRIEQDCFKTEGRILVKPGWLEVYGRRPGVAAGKDELCPGPHRRNRSRRSRGCPRRGNQTTRPDDRVHAAFRDGRCRQTHRRRSASRSHGRARPRHSRYSRGDHRRPDFPEIPCPRRPRTLRFRSRDAPHRPRPRDEHRGPLLAETHRRLGVQTPPDGAGKSQAQ